MSAAMERVFGDIRAERERQDARHDGGIERHVRDGDHLLALAVLTEEVGEVAQEVLRQRCVASPDSYHGAAHRTNAMRTELIQVAAVAVAWVQAIDGRGDAR